MKNTFLILAVLGGIVPYLFFLNFIQTEDFNLPVFLKSLFVNGAAGGFSADLLMASFAFWIFMLQQVEQRNSPKPYVFIALNLIVGLSCALPAYLYAREKLTTAVSLKT